MAITYLVVKKSETNLNTFITIKFCQLSTDANPMMDPHKLKILAVEAISAKIKNEPPLYLKLDLALPPQ